MLFAVAVVDAVNLEQIFFVACEIDARCTSFSVDRQRVNTPKLIDKTMGAKLVVIQIDEASNAKDVFCPERIGFATPCSFEDTPYQPWLFLR